MQYHGGNDLKNHWWWFKRLSLTPCKQKGIYLTLWYNYFAIYKSSLKCYQVYNFYFMHFEMHRWDSAGQMKQKNMHYVTGFTSNGALRIDDFSFTIGLVRLNKLDNLEISRCMLIFPDLSVPINKRDLIQK